MSVSACATIRRSLLLVATPAALAAVIGLDIRPAESQRSARQLYDAACAACHGADGAGRSQTELGFDIPMPDFTDCAFASREPDPDWYAVIHDGGPVRAFDRMMPAFGEALTGDEIQRILDHVRTFCTDRSWPRGELNLPRALVTEKAYPEDESVVTVSIPEGANYVETEWLYEKRFGPRSQFEIAIPLSYGQAGLSGDELQLGDLAVGLKHNLYHSLETGSILSVGAEVIVPVGDEDDGFGAGTAIFEPWIGYGQILPNDMFFQAQALGEFAHDSDVEDEFALRTAFGRTFAEGFNGFGRAWTPMVEVLASRALASGADTQVDVIPQLQVTLPTRQHIMLNAGVRIPVNHTEGRDTVFMMYFLWDWFDGGLTDGW